VGEGGEKGDVGEAGPDGEEKPESLHGVSFSFSQHFTFIPK
jgi:hypothetical protein